jgi:hypothetical protein
MPPTGTRVRIFTYAQLLSTAEYQRHFTGITPTASIQALFALCHTNIKLGTPTETK